jgi:hypothetical protein
MSPQGPATGVWDTYEPENARMRKLADLEETRRAALKLCAQMSCRAKCDVEETTQFNFSRIAAKFAKPQKN